MLLYNNKILVKIRLKTLIIGFFISFLAIVALTPIHEAGHWIMSDMSPFIEPIEYHVFDSIDLDNGPYTLNSLIGYVVVVEEYPGAFDERPLWGDFFQEIICVSVQIIISFFITIKSIIIIEKRFFIKNKFNF
jgi:hypothetical protein